MVILYGNSLFVAGVEASLRNTSGLDAVRIDATLPDAAQQLDALCPDAVIFDLTAPDSPFAIRFLSEHPGLPLVGLDLNSKKVLVLSGQQHTVLAANDLAQVIRQEAGSKKED